MRSRFVRIARLLPRVGARGRGATILATAAVLLVLPALPAEAAAAPLPPTGLTVTAVSSTEVELRWNQVTGATGYEVWWGGESYSELLATTTQTTWRHTYVGPGRTYEYAVRTVTRKARSALSAFVSVTTPPEAPSLVEAEVLKADQVRLTWQPGYGAETYRITEVAADGSETPVTVLDLQDRSATVQTTAGSTHELRIRGLLGSLTSLTYATVTFTTPPREPSVINLDAPGPVPAGPTTLTFSLSGTETVNEMAGTLTVSVDGGQAATVPVQGRSASVPVDLEPGTHTAVADYSGDGAYLPSTGTFTFQVAVTAPTFAVEQVDPGSTAAAAAADVTCDGRTDLVSLATSADYSTTSLDVRPGQADGTLGPVRSIGLAGNVAWLATGDLNGDRCADVATLGVDLVTFLGAPTRLATGSRVRGVGPATGLVLADLTGDGRLDAATSIGTGVTLLPGTGRGGFGQARIAVPHPAYFATADLDGDGRPDLVTTSDEGLEGWFGSGTGTFTRRWSTPGRVQKFTADDLTGDGRAEVLAITDSGVSILSGTDGSAAGSVPGIYRTPEVIATGDVDGDGLRDIVTADSSWSIGVSLSSPGGPTAIQYQRIDPYGTFPTSLLLADVSGDGRLDAVMTDLVMGLVVGRQT